MSQGERKPADDTSDLTAGSLWRQMFRLAMPASVGLFFQVLFNITDTFCAGLLSTDAQAALAFTFPIFFIVLAIAIGLMQGATGLLARSKGAGKFRQARYFFGQSYVLALVAGLALAACGFKIAPFLLRLLGATPAQLELGVDYILWIYAFAPLMIAVMIMSGVLTSHGNTRAFRNALIASALANVALDPILMFGWFGLPAMGMHGVGLATVIAWLLQLAIMYPAMVRLRFLQGWKPLYFLPRRTGLLSCLGQSWPPAANMMSICLGFFVITYYVAIADTVAVASYGIALRIEQLTLLPAHGINIGLLAIAGQNFGARLFSRLHDSYKIATVVGLAISVVGIVIMLGLGRFFISLFNEDPKLVSYGFQYLIAAAIISPFYVFIHNANAMLQAVGKPRMIGVFSSMRLFFLPTVFCWILVEQLDMGLAGVWVALVAANIIIALMMLAHTKLTVRERAPIVVLAPAT